MPVIRNAIKIPVSDIAKETSERVNKHVKEEIEVPISRKKCKVGCLITISYTHIAGRI